MNLHLTITGSNADHRYKVKPSQQGAAVVSLYNKIAALAGTASAGSATTGVEDGIAKAARDLWNSKGKSLVVSGSNDQQYSIRCKCHQYFTWKL